MNYTARVKGSKRNIIFGCGLSFGGFNFDGSRCYFWLKEGCLAAATSVLLLKETRNCMAFDPNGQLRVGLFSCALLVAGGLCRCFPVHRSPASNFFTKAHYLHNVYFFCLFVVAWEVWAKRWGL